MNKDEVDELKRDLAWFTETLCASGFEEDFSKKLKDLCRDYADKTRETLYGDLIFAHEGEGKKKILLTAHMDIPGAIVTSIDDDGFIRFTYIGGLDTRALPNQKVSLYTPDKVVIGVVGTKSLHLVPEDEAHRVTPMDELFVDIGAHSREEVEKLGIRIGTPMTFCSSLSFLQNNKVTGVGFDNRAFCAILYRLLRKVKEMRRTEDIFFAFTTREELSMLGCELAANIVLPDYAFILDIAPAGDTPDLVDSRIPVKLGGGPTFLIKQGEDIIHIPLYRKVLEIAAKHGIPTQSCSMEWEMTETHKIQEIKHGVPTLDICLPIRYAHSAVETVSLEDMLQIEKLLLALIEEIW
jgi:endoglucanase